MKILLFQIIFAVFTFSQAFCQNAENLFLLPSGSEKIVSEYINGDIVELYNLSFPANQPHTQALNIYATYSSLGDSVLIAELINRSNGYEIFQSAIPVKMEPIAILLYDQYLFVGGKTDVAILYMYDITSDIWQEVKLPENFSFISGKGVDAFTVHEEKLFVYDNIVMPNYLIIYDLTDLPELKILENITLKPNGTYEHIKMAANSPEYISILSSTVGGYAGSISNHITIINQNNLSRRISVSSYSRNYRYDTWNDLVILNNRIYIASDTRGLGTLKIRERFFRNSDHKRFDRGNKTISNRKIRYKKIDNYTSLIGVKNIPGSNIIVGIFKDDKGIYSYRIIKE